MTQIKKVCIFCASSSHIDKVYFKDAEILANILLENNIHVVYGGGHAGLMGCIADAYLKAGGQITGVIPGFMKEMKWSHPGVTDMVEVKTMHERKEIMIRDADAIIALPGGVGTLEELTEVITLKQLGQFLSPIVILNTSCYYTHLDEFFHKMMDEKFMRKQHKEIWQIVDSPTEVFPAILNAPPWHGSAINYAAVGD